MMHKGFVYLGQPYSDPCPLVRQERYEAGCRAAAALMQQGVSVFSPIAGSHHIADFCEAGNATNFDFWMQVDLPILRRCDAMIILKLDGWEKSRGVAREVAECLLKNIPIHMMEWTQ